MRTEAAERQLSRYLDGTLPEAKRKAVESRLRHDAALRGAKADFEEIGRTLREMPVPAGRTPEATWADVRRALRAEKPPGTAFAPGSLLGSRLGWAGAMLGALFLGVGAMVFFKGGGPEAMAAAAPTVVEWVETDLPNAMTMVYQDEDTGLTVIWVQQEEPPEGQNVGS